MKFVPRSEDTHRFIIEATAELFNKKGALATSISDLEKATGMTRGSIYGNFENKSAVAVAVFDYNWELKRNLIKERVRLCKSYKDQLLTHVLIHYPAAKAPFTAGGCPLQNTAVEADDTNDELRTRAAKGLMTWKQDMVEIIELGIQAKEFKPNTDPAGTALHIISIIEGAAMITRATQNLKYANQLLDNAQQVIKNITF